MSKVKIINTGSVDLSDYKTVPTFIPRYKTELRIGEGDCAIVWYLTKRFNWFQKKMLEFCFGFKVNDIN